MILRYVLAAGLVVFTGLQACLQSPAPNRQTAAPAATSFTDANGKTWQVVVKSEAEWKQELDAAAYHVLREKGTERAFTGEYHASKKQGIYQCRGCGLPLFSSDTKFDSGTGWPSYSAPIDKAYILEETDTAYGMRRTEVLCRRCGGHLGHVFDDGPRPTGLRYCINAAALEFKPE